MRSLAGDCAALRAGPTLAVSRCSPWRRVQPLGLAGLNAAYMNASTNSSWCMHAQVKFDIPFIQEAEPCRREGRMHGRTQHIELSRFPDAGTAGGGPPAWTSAPWRPAALYSGCCARG